MRRVAVTGMGIVSPLGTGVSAFWEGISAGRSGVSPITHFDASAYPSRIAGYCADFDPADVLDPKEARRMSRYQQFALVAASEAMAQADLVVDDELAPRFGVIVGSGIGGLHVMEEQHDILRDRGPGRVSPFLVPMMITDLAAGLISIKYGAQGINYCPVSACATGNHAIGEAGEAIRRGTADVVIAGGFDAGVTELGVAGFCALRALSTRNDDPAGASRPFDADRDGFVIAEGGAVLVLEAWELAEKRGATILGELLGYGASADAYHITSPHPEGDGAARAMRAALEQAGVAPSAVGYINAHGTSTPQGDAGETLAITSVFGADPPPVSSTKSMTGHALGGAGAMEAIACIMALREGTLPPTINLQTPDPACDLDYVPNVARATDASLALSNSFGFGGHNACLLFGRA